MTQLLKPIPSAADAPQGDPTVALAATMPRKDDLALKYFQVELPSKGKLGYPAEVEYRDILVRDEKVLASTTATNYVSVLHKVLKSLLKDQTYFDNMCIHDRDYLLVWVWANCYSAEKSVEVMCPVCEKESTKIIDLTALKVDDIAEDIQVPFEYETENGFKLFIKPFTIAMQDAANTYVKDHPDCDFDTAAIALSFSIENRTASPALHIKFVENNIRGKDFAMVRAFHEHYKFGIDDEVTLECPHCKEVSQVRVPFQIEWLRPSDGRDFEKLLQSHKGTAHQPD